MRVLLLLVLLTGARAAINYQNTYDFAGTLPAYDLCEAGLTVTNYILLPYYQAYTYLAAPPSVAPKDLFNFEMTGIQNLRSCKSNTFTQADRYIQFCSNNATLLWGNFSTKNSMSVPTGHTIEDVRFAENCSNMFVLTAKISTN